MKQTNITRNQNINDGISFNYDQVNDLLYLHKKGTLVYNTAMLGDFHIEFSENGKVVGVEILNVSDALKKYNISKAMLGQLTRTEITTCTRDQVVIITLTFYSSDKEHVATITLDAVSSPVEVAAA